MMEIFSKIEPIASRVATRCRVLRLAAYVMGAACFSLASAVYAGSSYPDKPIRLVVPFPAGGGSDILARILAAKMGPMLKQTVVVENISGATGTIGSTKVARSAPDGYTLLLGISGTHAIAPAIMPRLGYDPLRDFVPLARIAYGGNVLVANPSFSAQSLPALIALAKKPGSDIAFGSWGQGSGGHLAGISINVAAGIQLRHVPYKGASPVLTDLMTGTIPIAMSDIATALPLIKGGKIRALAVSGSDRSPALPEVPTFAEAGIPIKLDIWFALFAPSGVPKPILDKLEQVSQAAIRDADVQRKIGEYGLLSTPITRGAFAEQIQSDTRAWASLVKATGAKFDQ